jgi:hypothetical protein
MRECQRTTRYQETTEFHNNGCSSINEVTGKWSDYLNPLSDILMKGWIIVGNENNPILLLEHE